VEFNARRFEVVKMDGQRIAQVRVDPIIETEAVAVPDESAETRR
jgi:dUTPase